jgi:hypothetical protein
MVHITRAPLTAFLKGGALQSGPTAPAFDGQTVIDRALAQVGQPWNYNPLSHNCQHWSSWCVSGSSVSSEAEALMGVAQNMAQQAMNTVEGAEQGAEHAVEGAEQHAEHALEGAEHAAQGAEHAVQGAAQGAMNRGRSFLSSIRSRF